MDWGTAASDERNYTYDGIDKIIVKDDAGDSIESYVPGRSDFPGIGRLLLFKDHANSGIYGFIFDEVGTTLGFSNIINLKSHSYSYDSFGNLLESIGICIQYLMFETKEFDTHISQTNFLYRFYYNYYNRCLSKDKYSSLAIHNSYLFLRNSPLNFYDPLGDEEKPINPPTIYDELASAKNDMDNAEKDSLNNWDKPNGDDFIDKFIRARRKYQKLLNQLKRLIIISGPLKRMENDRLPSVAGKFVKERISEKDLWWDIVIEEAEVKDIPQDDVGKFGDIEIFGHGDPMTGGVSIGENKFPQGLSKEEIEKIKKMTTPSAIIRLMACGQTVGFIQSTANSLDRIVCGCVGNDCIVNTDGTVSCSGDWVCCKPSSCKDRQLPSTQPEYMKSLRKSCQGVGDKDLGDDCKKY